jgi:hypothetical protein
MTYPGDCPLLLAGVLNMGINPIQSRSMIWHGAQTVCRELILYVNY